MYSNPWNKEGVPQKSGLFLLSTLAASGRAVRLSPSFSDQWSQELEGLALRVWTQANVGRISGPGRGPGEDPAVSPPQDPWETLSRCTQVQAPLTSFCSVSAVCGLVLRVRPQANRGE